MITNLLNIFKRETLFSKTDILEIQVAENLVEFYKKFNSAIKEKRKILFEKYGYLIPGIRGKDNPNLDNNEYVIKLRNNIVAKGKIYPDRVMLVQATYNPDFVDLPKDIIESTETAYGTKSYWIKRKDIPLGVYPIESVDVLATHIEKTCFKYIDEIIDYDYVIAMLEDFRKSQPKLYNNLKKFLPEIWIIRKVIVKLLREEVSIRDINFFIEHLCEYYKFSQDADILSERMRSAFGRQICLKYCFNNTLYVVQLSDEWEKLLDKQVQKTELGSMFLLNPSQCQTLVESTKSALLKVQQQIGKKTVVVVLCSPRIRLPLYELLERFIPAVVVIAYSELITDIKVEAFDKIGELFN